MQDTQVIQVFGCRCDSDQLDVGFLENVDVVVQPHVWVGQPGGEMPRRRQNVRPPGVEHKLRDVKLVHDGLEALNEPLLCEISRRIQNGRTLHVPKLGESRQRRGLVLDQHPTSEAPPETFRVHTDERSHLEAQAEALVPQNFRHFGDIGEELFVELEVPDFRLCYE